MVPTGLEERVRSLEETSQLMRNVPVRLDRIDARLDRVEVRLDQIDARLDDVQLQILRTQGGVVGGNRCQAADGLRVELRGEMHAIRDELRAEMYAIRDELRAEMYAIRDELARRDTVQHEETRRHMAVLLEHAVGQMHALFDASRRAAALNGRPEGRPCRRQRGASALTGTPGTVCPCAELCLCCA